ncbi:hypothetical protein HG530_013401 [Fusarium avenaceum]|nr:hypothetical protein HG530_013401 [Fusarium avenaceum]
MSSQSLSQTHGCCGLALAEGSRGNTSDNNISTVFSVLQSLQQAKINLGLVCTIRFKFMRRNANLGSDTVDDVLHQHGNGHRPNTAGNRSDGGGNLNCGGVVDITNKSVARLLGGIGQKVGSHVDDNGTRLQPAGLNKQRLANGSDNNIRVLDISLNVLSLGVHNGNGSVSVSQKVAHRATDNVTSSKDNSVLSLQVNARLLKKDHDTLGCARHEKRLTTPLGQLSNVLGTKSVNILLIRHKRCDSVLGDMLRERQLDQDSVNSRVMVELPEMIKKLWFCDRLRVVQQLAVNTSL